jgi:hypothetical protein
MNFSKLQQLLSANFDRWEYRSLRQFKIDPKLRAVANFGIVLGWAFLDLSVYVHSIIVFKTYIRRKNQA